VQQIQVRQIMTPRTQVDYLKLGQPIADTLRVVQSSAYTRLPLCDGDLDHVIGFVHMKDLFNHLELMPGRLRLLDEKTEQGELIAIPDGAPGSAVHVIGSGNIDLQAISRQVLFIPELVSVQQALQQFQEHHTHMAVVVDEYGVTKGIVTLEDSIEQFVGEIQDEFDFAPHSTLIAEGGQYRVSGLCPMLELCERLGIDEVPDADIETLSGHITQQLGRFPQPGDEVTLGPYAVRVLSVNRNRVRQAVIERQGERAGEDETGENHKR
jgi:CBS domain containing-hemolysin-like protein